MAHSWLMCLSPSENTSRALTNSTLSSSMVLPASLTMPCSTNSKGDGNVHPVLLSEPNMAGFFTQMICGGTAFICTRLAEASEDEKIIYLDANNLYGWTMSQKLSALQWVQVDEPV